MIVVGGLFLFFGSPGLGSEDDSLVPFLYLVKIQKNDLLYEYKFSFNAQRDFSEDSEFLMDGEIQSPNLTLSVSDGVGSVCVEFPLATRFPYNGYNPGKIISMFSSSEVFYLPEIKEPGVFIFGIIELVVVERMIGNEVKRVERIRGTSVPLNYIEKKFEAIFESIRIYMDDSKMSKMDRFLKEYDDRKLRDKENELKHSDRDRGEY